MPIYYVATLARYVLVQADNEAQARERGQFALYEQRAGGPDRSGSHAPIEICTVRLATPDEIGLSEWHQQFSVG